MIEANWTEATVRRFSLAQLTWVLRRRKVKRIERDRQLIFIVAAGSNGGDAFKLVMRGLERELDELEHRSQSEQIESEMPLSSEEFMSAMKEQNGR